MPQFAEKPSILTLMVEVRPDAKAAFIDWQAKLNAHIASFPGFVSLEFLSPSEQKGWCVVERFRNSESATSWHVSKERQELMQELKGLSFAIQEAPADPTSMRGVTEVFVTAVHPAQEQAYREWSAKIHQVEAKFPGFRGVYVQSPNQGDHWITLLQFDTMENLDRWLQSPERQKLLDGSNSFISSLESHRVISPYAGWFASIAQVGEVPPVWKQTMIVLLVLFPIVMFELKYLSPLTAGLNSSIATFISNAISVTLISFPMMPIAILFLGWWLSPSGQKRHLLTLMGTLVVLLLYLIEIGLLWHFL